jgi:hypothetical protein
MKVVGPDNSKARIGGQLQNFSLMPTEWSHIPQRAEVCAVSIDIHCDIESHNAEVEKYAL